MNSVIPHWNTHESVRYRNEIVPVYPEFWNARYQQELQDYSIGLTNNHVCPYDFIRLYPNESFFNNFELNHLKSIRFNVQTPDVPMFKYLKREFSFCQDVPENDWILSTTETPDADDWLKTWEVKLTSILNIFPSCVICFEPIMSHQQIKRIQNSALLRIVRGFVGERTSPCPKCKQDDIHQSCRAQCTKCPLCRAPDQSICNNEYGGHVSEFFRNWRPNLAFVAGHVYFFPGSV